MRQVQCKPYCHVSFCYRIFLDLSILNKEPKNNEGIVLLYLHIILSFWLLELIS